MTDRPPLPPHIWSTLSPEAQAAVSALILSLEQRIADLEERVNSAVGIRLRATKV